MLSVQDQNLWTQDLLAWLEEIKSIPNDEKKVQALACLLAELPPSKSTLLTQALDFIESSTKEEMSPHLHPLAVNTLLLQSNAKLLANIASNLSPSQPRLIKQVLDIVEKYSELFLVGTLVNIAPHVRESQPQLFEQFIHLADYQALTVILAHPNLSEAWLTKVLPIAFESINKIDNALNKVKSLATIASISNLSESQHTEVLQQAFKVIENISYEPDKAKALILIAPYLSISHRQEVLETALDILHRIEYDIDYESDLIKNLIALTSHLDESLTQFQQKVFDLAEKGSEINRVKILVALAADANLNESEHTKVIEQALNVAEFQVLNENQRFQAFMEIAPYLAKSQVDLLEKALKIAKNFQWEVERFQAIAAIAAHFDEFQHTEILQEALNFIQKTEKISNSDLVKSFVAIASAFRAKNIQLLPQFLDIFNSISDAYPNEKLTAIAMISAHSNNLEVSQQAIDILEKFLNQDNITPLSAFFKHFKGSLHPEFLQRILSNKSFDVIVDTAIYLNKYELTEVLEQALTIAETIEDEQYRTDALVSIISCLDESEVKLLEQSLIFLNNIKNEDKVKILGTIAPHLNEFQPQLLQTAIQFAQKYDEQQGNPTIYEVQALTIIASNLTDSQIKTDLLQQAFDWNNYLYSTDEKVECFITLVNHLNKSQTKLLAQAYSFTEEIEYSQYHQFKALAHILPHLSAEEQVKCLNQIIKIVDEWQIEHQEQIPISAIIGIIPHLRESERSQFLPKVIKLLLKNQISEQLPASTITISSLPEFKLEFQQQLSSINFSEREHYYLISLIIALGESQPSLIEKALEHINEQLEQQILETYAFEIFAAITPYLSESEPQILNKAFEVAQKFQEYNTPIKSLVAIAPYFSEPKHTEILQQALDIIQESIWHDYDIDNLINILSDIAACIKQPQSPLLQKILEIVQGKIQNNQIDRYKERIFKIISQIATRFSEEVAAQISISTALKCVIYIEGDENKTKFLSALAPRLSSGLFPSALRLIIENIIHPAYRAEAFSNLAPYIPAYLFSEALDLIESKIIIPSSQADALSSLVPYISIDQIPEALRIAHCFRGDSYHWQVLIAIASRLSNLLDKQNTIFSETINKSETPSDISSQATSLSPEELQKELDLIKRVSLKQINFSDIAELQRKIKAVVHAETSLQIVALLIDLAPKLYQAESKFFQQAIELANGVRDIKYRVEVLSALAAQLSPSEPELLQKILAATQKFSNQKYRETVYQSLKNNLPIALTQHMLKLLKDNNLEACEEYKNQILCIVIPKLKSIQFAYVIEIIRAFTQERYKAQALKLLVTKLSNNQQELNTALQITQGFQQTYSKAKVLSGIFEKLPEVRELAQKDIKFNFLHPEVLLDVASCSGSSQDQINILRYIRDLTNAPYLQCRYLESLVPYLQPENMLESQSVAQEIQDKYYNIKALIALACKFPQFRAVAQRQAQDFKNQRENFVASIKLLSSLAVEVPEILPNILKYLELKTIQPEIVQNNTYFQENEIEHWEQKQILIALKPHLPLRIVREIDRERKKGKIPHELWYRSLKILRKTYRDALSGGSFRNDTDFNQDLLNLKDEIDALADMLLMRDLEPPVAVGILGGWGGGKSYIMHLMQNRMLEVRSGGINENEAWNENPNSDELYPYVGHIYQIKFDAWTYAKSHLWSSLMQTIFWELDRQITLEQQLIKAGINACAESGAKVWQVLYQSNDDDRKWFLERVLTEEQLQQFQANSKNHDLQDSLWKILTKSQQDAVSSCEQTKRELINKQEKLKIQEAELLSELRENENKLQNVKEQLQTQLQNAEEQLQDEQKKLIQKKHNEEINFEISEVKKNSYLALGYSAVVLKATLGSEGFTKIFDQKIQAEVNQKLNLEKFNIKPENVNQLSSFLKGVVTVAISNNYQSITVQSFKGWFNKNRLLITIFVFCLFLAIILPVTINLIKPNIIAQLIGFLTPTLPAIANL
ncbi:P-loop NTPase fold protein [Nostoc sp. FACHB-145]|uniref:P-loop NTPase fold protein n=1 Tax=Nostoc sp. FACHB-145 TaxID=2692836 RepID=UPI001686E9B9|nr:P-loop NTPase fold protein [Nostoc sp. FACHB-145]MBD2469576.1 hypothetical protein [Nostoc sp. FACHB-145]